MSIAIVGRDDELASAHSFIASVPGGPCVLVLSGEAGVGKTTLWRHATAEAASLGIRVLSARPAEQEIGLSFSAVRDLLDPVLDEALAPLPVPQRRALSRALVVDAGRDPVPDPHAIGVALLGALRSLAAARPLVVAIDDVQWLDAASAAALTYAGRRLETEQLGLLLARRVPLESGFLSELRRSFPSSRLVELAVGPLDPHAVGRLVHDQLGVVLPRPVLLEVHDAAGGNPFYALELVRTLPPRRAGDTSARLRVPESLHELVHDRLRALPPPTREYLLAAAAMSQPTVALARAGSGVSPDQGLSPALAAGVVHLEGDRLRFTHPLLAAGAYEIADSLHRRDLHARLAELVDDPEERARHLAASVIEPDESVAGALEDAAAHARNRGAVRAAALLLERAHELTPSDRTDDMFRRAVDAAYAHYESGDSHRAEVQLREIVAALAPGRRRARALVRLARVRAYEALREAVALFLQAAEETEGDREVLAVAHEGAATCLWRLYERLDEALEHAGRAADVALELGNEALAGEALGTRLAAELLLGRDSAAATAALAATLQPASEHLRVLAQPRSSLALDYLGWTGDLGRAREEMLDLLRCASDLGDESSPPFMLAHLALVEIELGNLEAAHALAREGQQASEQAGQRAILAFNIAAEALVEAQRGREVAATSAAMRALELVEETGSRQAELVATHALGHLQLALGNPDAVVARLEPMRAFVASQGIVEPSATRFVLDEVEALIELGQLERARELLGPFEVHAERLRRRCALGVCARCRGLLASAEGRMEEALAAFDEALTWHDSVDVPLERARTQLARGATLRRAKRRRDARATLENAIVVSERLGASAWAQRARGELGRVGGRAPSGRHLTPVEQRVAELVAAGRTNREVAGALFLSTRTVESHLQRVYGKLGVHSRVELARKLA